MDHVGATLPKLLYYQHWCTVAIKLLEKTEANVEAFACLIELTNLKGRDKITVKTDSLLTFDE